MASKRTEPTSLSIDGGFEAQFLGSETSKTLRAPVETWVVFPQGDRGSPVLQVQIYKTPGQLLWQAWTGNFTRARDRELAQRVAAARNGTGNAQETMMAKKNEGATYALKQIQSSYFRDWVRDQLVEASKMDPRDVHSLKTKEEALVVAENMLQQLEWDAKREVRDKSPSFWKEFGRACSASRGRLADELVEMNTRILREPRGIVLGHRNNVVGSFKLGAPRPGTRVRDYIAVDGRGRKIAGPFKSYADAKDAAGPGGHTQFVPSARTREVPRGAARSTRRGTRRRP